MPDYPLVMIEWVDAFGCSTDWREMDNLDTESLLCRSVGWLVHDGDGVKVIVPHMAEERRERTSIQGCGDMSIPAVSVTQIITLSREPQAAHEGE